jgi:hypothetical protein
LGCCNSLTEPNQLELQLTKLQFIYSSTTLLIMVCTRSPWIRSNRMSKFPCQSLLSSFDSESSDLVVADRFRTEPPRGVHALPASPHCERVHTYEGQADNALPPSLAIPSLCSSSPSGSGKSKRKPDVATENSTMPKHRYLIPLSRSTARSSSTSSTSSCNRCQQVELT